jgi:hypothetical protein
MESTKAVDVSPLSPGLEFIRERLFEPPFE